MNKIKTNIKKGDNVIVVTGKDKGRTGSVLKMVKKRAGFKLGSRTDVFVLVENLNIVKKHVKPNPQKQQPGGIISKESPIPISNVGLFNPSTKKAGKVGLKFLEDGTKVRYFKKTGEVIDV